MRAQLLHLTGPLRGETRTHDKGEILIGTSPEADLRYTEGITVKPRHAVLRFLEQGYLFKALEGEIFVNDKELAEVILESGDLLQLGRGGPLMRYRPVASRGRPRKAVSQILRDARDVGNRSGIYASSIALRRDLRRHTTWTFRIVFPVVVIAASFGIAYLGGWLGSRSSDEELETRHREEVRQYEEEFARLRRQIRAYQSAQETRASRDEMLKIRDELERHAAVVTGLANERAAFKRVLEEYSRGVCLLHGRFTLKRRRGNQLIPVRRPDKKILELEYVGSGFLASSDGLVVTNRHVAEPWWRNNTVAKLLQNGLVPEFLSLYAVFPDRPPIEVDTTTIRISDEGVDVAVLRVAVHGVPVLPLMEQDAASMRGGRVMLLGYPTGVNALLARADSEIAGMIVAESKSTTELIAKLAEHKAISPVITQGSLNEVTATKLVYDAETTVGGSGGPVFGPNGRVIGVNYAVTRDFDGSNFGIPIRFARTLLARRE